MPLAQVRHSLSESNGNSHIGAVRDGRERVIAERRQALASRFRIPPGVTGDVARLLEAIHESVFEPDINVQALRNRSRARDHNVSSRFKAEIGISMRMYIATLRVYAAADLLRTTDWPITEISHTIGYDYLQTFYRDFRKVLAATPGSVRRIAPPPLTLEPDQYKTLAAAIERILPNDVSGPGVLAAGGMHFIEHALATGLCRGDLARVVGNLYLLDECSQAMFESPFVDANAAQKSQVLQRLRDVPHSSVLRFVISLVRVALAAFLCAPRHGGNRDGQGWRYLGYVPHRLTHQTPT